MTTGTALKFHSYCLCFLISLFSTCLVLEANSATVTLLDWSLIWCFGLRRNSCQMPACTIVPVQQGRMCGNSVVPNHDSTRLPLHPSLKVLTLGNMVVQEVQQEVAFFFLETNNTTAELWVYKQCLLASGWVRANQRMNGCHWFATDNAPSIPAIVRLLYSCSIFSIQKNKCQGYDLPE